MDLDTPAGFQRWQQITIHFADYTTAEPTAVRHLHSLMRQATDDGLIDSWWFIRKAPCWRLRYHPIKHAEHPARARIRQALDHLRDEGQIVRWVETIYEPEIHAFGGQAAMHVAHRLFHEDSRHILANLADNSGINDQRRELAILLATALMRGAGQDWYEQGDIWARLAENRPLSPDTAPSQLRRVEPQIRRLMTADLMASETPGNAESSPAYLRAWAAAFWEGGRALGEFAGEGTLRRALRSVLAHHVIFHLNRIGLPFGTQALLVHAARAVVLG